MYTIMLLVESVLAAVVLSTLIKLTLYLHFRQRHEQFFATEFRLNSAVTNAVKEIQQVLAGDFKAARVDGRLKGDTANEIRATAVKAMLAHLGPLGLRELRRALGLSRKTSIDRVLVGRLEAAVYDLKNHQLTPNKVPAQPGMRFVPDTMRIPRAQHSIPEEDAESLYNEPTPKRG
jgi:hypothetical protein